MHSIGKHDLKILFVHWQQPAVLQYYNNTRRGAARSALHPVPYIYYKKGFREGIIAMEMWPFVSFNSFKVCIYSLFTSFFLIIYYDLTRSPASFCNIHFN